MDPVELRRITGGLLPRRDGQTVAIRSLMTATTSRVAFRLDLPPFKPGAMRDGAG